MVSRILRNARISAIARAGAPLLVDKWNRADADPRVMFPDDFTAMTVDDNPLGQDDLVRSVFGRANGKTRVEFVTIKVTSLGGDNMAIGFAADDMSLGNYLGQDLKGVGLWSSGNVYFGDVMIASMPGLIQTTEVTRYVMYTDWAAQLVWFANVTRGSHLNDNPSANPVTGVGGLSFAGIVGTRFHLCADFEKAGQRVKLVTGQEAYEAPALAGYGNWRSL